MSKRIFVLLPDGVSLRNFAYTSFYQMGIDRGYEVVFWNATPFDLQGLGFSEIAIEIPRVHWLTDILKTARIRCELKLFSKRTGDPIYKEYLFPLSFKSLKNTAKSLLVRWYSFMFSSEDGVEKLRRKIIQKEKQTDYFQQCKATLKRERPDIVFCASQRSVTAIAPLAAANDLGIPTASFIFSWDNVPKATTVITADYYFVWSEHMRKELLYYQKYILPEQIMVTGTPQFEPHFEPKRLLSRALFCEQHNLDPELTYLCYSGDDVTTSPKDEFYLRDVAKAIRNLNSKGRNLKLIFRRCPVDFSNRYDLVLETYNDVIVEMPPLWKKIGDAWNTVLPLPEDLDLQANIIAHTAGVINLASSMVFDYVAHGKPCAYMNYNYLNREEKAQEGVYLYNFVHFRSMPSPNAVIWLSNPEQIGIKLEAMLNGVPETVEAAKKWFKTINLDPPTGASERIWQHLTAIMRTHTTN